MRELIWYIWSTTFQTSETITSSKTSFDGYCIKTIFFLGRRNKNSGSFQSQLMGFSILSQLSRLVRFLEFKYEILRNTFKQVLSLTKELLVVLSLSWNHRTVSPLVVLPTRKFNCVLTVLVIFNCEKLEC